MLHTCSTIATVTTYTTIANTTSITSCLMFSSLQRTQCWDDVGEMWHVQRQVKGQYYYIFTKVFSLERLF